MTQAKPPNPETKKKIIAELEKGRKPLQELLRKLAASDTNAEKIEKANA